MIAIYPGSFDPITFGHMDIIDRALKICDNLVVAVLDNPRKMSFFSTQEKLEHLNELTKAYPTVSVLSFDGLLVNFAKEQNARFIIRGLRAVTDFEYEFQMSLANRELDKGIETLFISTSLEHLYISSSIVKEIARYGGDVDKMVPVLVKRALYEKNKNIKREA